MPKIAVTKKVISFGAGNQVEALKSSEMNSKFRMDAMREPSYWELGRELIKMAQENREALVAAKAELVHGGNCGSIRRTRILTSQGRPTG